METEIYKMKLHEVIQFPNGLYVMRVAGGWIYAIARNGGEDIPRKKRIAPFDNKFEFKQCESELKTIKEN